MYAIEYVVRTSASGAQSSVFPADKNVYAPNAGGNQEISLNLRQSDIRGYTREGSNLEIALADGRVIILEGYFGEDGSAQSRLFISADGYLNEVSVVESGDGSVYAQYGPTEQWGKWSPSDDLIFLDGSDVALAETGDEDVSMLGAAGLLGGSGLLGAAGIGAAGLVAAGLSGGGGSSSMTSADSETPDPSIPTDPTDPSAPTVNAEPIIIGGDEVGPEDEVISITGTADPGALVKVTIGDKVVETTADENGNWDARFEGEDFPEDGTYSVDVIVCEEDGTETGLDGPQVVIDTTPPDTALDATTVATDDVVNLEEYNQGVSVTGTGEVGASILVTIEGITHTTTVSETGTWDVIYPAGELPMGEYDTVVTVVSSDSYGNTTTITEDVRIDTVPHPITINADTVETDGTINFVEESDGFTITGTSTPGATLAVTIEGVKQSVTVSEDGTWSATYAAGVLPGGEYDATVTTVAVDSAGNRSKVSETVRVDTLVRNFTMSGETGGSDGVINAAEKGDGFTITGTTEPGSTVVLEMNGQTVNGDVDASGTWTASFSGSQISSGTYAATLVATTTDAAGNVETLSQQVDVDTEAGRLTLNAAAIGGDGTINEVEAAAGVDVTGTADPNATVVVTLDGVSHTTTADGDGNWTTTYSSAEITPGVHQPEVSAITTDAAGNARSVEAKVNVDTRVDNLAFDPHDLAVTTDGAEVINNDVASSGFDITGTVEVGSTVSVTLDGVTHDAVVDENGNWTASFGAGEITAGERDADLVVNVTDPAGNTAQLNETVEVDTFVNTLTQTGAIEGDDVINAAEASDGVTVGGKVEPGSTVQVTAFGATYDATVDGVGNWSVDIPAGDIPLTESTQNIVIAATDSAGNTRSITEQVTVDTLAPEDPDMVGYFREVGGYRTVTAEQTDDDVTIHQVDGGGTISEAAVVASDDDFLGETDYHFVDGAGRPTTIPDGSELIVTNEDAAGNTSSTYMVLDETAGTTVDLSNPDLGDYNVEAIDLRFGDNSELTITEAEVTALSETSDQVVIKGGVDDTVTITGATASGTTTIDGENFDVYTLGSDATVIVDDDINVVI